MPYTTVPRSCRRADTNTVIAGTISQVKGTPVCEWARRQSRKAFCSTPRPIPHSIPKGNRVSALMTHPVRQRASADDWPVETSRIERRTE